MRTARTVQIPADLSFPMSATLMPNYSSLSISLNAGSISSFSLTLT